MNTFRLLWRNLTYFRAPAIAVIAGTAVATAALAGALMVGDSVKGSLRTLAVQRLGKTDYALVGNRFFPESLAARIAKSPNLAGKYDVAAGVVVTGGASTGVGDSVNRTGDVQIAALGAEWAPVEPGAAILNLETARPLGVSVAGNTKVEFQVPIAEETPRDAAVARRDVIDTTARLPVGRVSHVVGGNDMLALFNLNGGQRVPRNAWVSLSSLQDAIGQPAKANVMLVHATTGAPLEALSAAQAARESAIAAADLNAALKTAADLPDYGLDVKRAGKSQDAVLTSAGTYLPPAALAAANAATKLGVTPRLVTVNLVNRVFKIDRPTTQPAVNRGPQIPQRIAGTRDASRDGEGAGWTPETPQFANDTTRSLTVAARMGVSARGTASGFLTEIAPLVRDDAMWRDASRDREGAVHTAETRRFASDPDRSLTVAARMEGSALIIADDFTTESLPATQADARTRDASRDREGAVQTAGTCRFASDPDRSLTVAARMGVSALVAPLFLTTQSAPAAQPDVTPDGALHYVIGAGISALDDGPLAQDEIALNEVTARQLGAAIGDRIGLDYFERKAGGELAEVSSADKGFTFRVKRILPMTGLGTDPSLTPEYKGLTDAPSVSAWDPPKELGIVGDKLKRAEKDNDAYWKTYKASPRLFVNIDVARKMWGGPYGDVTSVRVPIEQLAAFRQAVNDAIDPAAMGMTFRPVKAEQLAAASGGTDFAGLFVALSFFLIAAAALLVAMLFRLMVEQRARQFGLLAAVGYTPWRLRKLALGEGMLLAGIGAAIGLGVAVAYTAAIIYGLRTRWVGAVGTTALFLYVEPMTLAIGFFASLFVAFIALLWGVWRVGKLSPSRLLAGGFAVGAARKSRTGKWSRLIGIGLAIVGLLVLLLVFFRVVKEAEMALAAGALLLTGGLVWLGGWLRPRRHAGASTVSLSSVAALGVRNASRHTARSVMSVGLIAFAAFTLITVAAFQNTSPPDTGDPKSGAGGFRLVVKAGVPILGDLNTPEGREQAGVRVPDRPELRAAEQKLWDASKIIQLRRWAGQDISCLNLTKSTSPTILGVPKSFTAIADADKHRFTFAGAIKDVANPWTLLDAEISEADPIPVITDEETAAFILKLGVGDLFPLTDQAGNARQLRLVGTLAHSMFQGEMLMNDVNFRRLFPAQSGFGTLLVDTQADNVEPMQRLLNRELEPFAVSVDTTASRLAAYQTIMNTYLDTFRLLGSLGLALGSIGLAVVLIRNVIERRPELALLSALGFGPKNRVTLILSENLFLLALGLIVGTACAVLGILPTVIRSKSPVAWTSLALTLLGVLVLGFIASVVAVVCSGVRTTAGELRRE